MDSLDHGIDAAARGDLDAAIRDCTEAIEAKQRLPLAYRFRGHTYVRMGEWQRAVSDLDKAIMLDPMAANPHASRAYALLMSGDYARAISDCSRAIEFDPRLVSAYAYRAHARMKLRDWEGALADFTLAIEIGAGSSALDSDNRCHRGYVFWRSGDRNSALADLDAAIATNPKNAQALYYRAVVREEIGETHKAVEDLGRAKELGFEPCANPAPWSNQGGLKQGGDWGQAGVRH